LDDESGGKAVEYVRDQLSIRLIGALHHVVDQGLKPHIKTGNIPVKLSDVPEVGVMEVNLKPPSDYDQYYAYMKALADALVAEFGLAEVKTWTWGVFTEYENPEWFGASNLTVGAHSMTVTEGLWDELVFIDHVAGVGPNGVNYKTGLRGTQIDFLTAWSEISGWTAASRERRPIRATK